MKCSWIDCVIINNKTVNLTGIQNIMHIYQKAMYVYNKFSCMYVSILTNAMCAYIKWSVKSIFVIPMENKRADWSTDLYSRARIYSTHILATLHPLVYIWISSISSRICAYRTPPGTDDCRTRVSNPPLPWTAFVKNCLLLIS